METFIEILMYVVLITGILDAYKYRLQARKVCRLKSSGQISRLSLLYACMHRTPLFLYVWLGKHDVMLMIVAGVGLYTTLDALYSTYLYYPYRNRGLKNFKKPSFWAFIKDTLKPHKNRKR